MSAPTTTLVTLDDGERTSVLDAPGPPGNPTVVLLHGLGATTALNFPGSFEALAGRFRVLGLDHRGHGQGFRARDPFTLEQAAADVIAIADRIGAERLILVGYSMGGAVALHAARTAPDRIVGLVACATAARFEMGDPDATRIGPLLSGLRSMPLRTRRRFVRLVLPYLGERSGIAADDIGVLRGHDPAALWEAIRSLACFDARPWAGSLGVPAVSIIPSADRVVPVARQRELAALLGAAPIIVEGDHRVAAVRPDAFLPALVHACGRLSSRSA